MIFECLPARHLFIAMPTSDGRNCAATTVSLVVGAVLLERAGVISEIYWQTAAPESHARNILVKRFLESAATDLLFIDTDVGCDPRAIVHITRVCRPLVVGVYPMKTNAADRWPVEFRDTTITLDKDGLLNPEYGPTGFMRLNRSVFDYLDYEDYTYQMANGEYEKVQGWFRQGVFDGKLHTTDVDVCRRWRALGGRVYMIPDIDFTHTGPHCWAGNWAAEHQRR